MGHMVTANKYKHVQIKEIKKYIEMYDTERFLFSVVGELAKKRRFLLFDEFYRICMWKSARQKQRYISNKNTVEEITKDAFQEKNEEKKIQLLCSMRGVGVPTASALLTVVFPKQYAIIDIRCIEMLRSEEFNYKISKYISVKTWLRYLAIVRDIAKENNVTPREVDMALFAMHREELERQDFKNLYGYRNTE